MNAAPLHLCPQVPSALGHPKLCVALLQQKGGCGKTTLAINLAAAAHLEGARTLIIDLDRQASAFDWGAARAADSPLDGLSVVRADRALPLARFREMARGYDYVFLDGPPRLGDVTESAAIAADVVALPIQPGPFDFWAVADTITSLDRADSIREQLALPPLRRRFVVNRANASTKIARDAEIGLNATEIEIAGAIHQRVAFPESAAHGDSVLSVATSDAASEVRRLWRALKGAAR